MTHDMIEQSTRLPKREQRMLARYEKRPAPPSVYREQVRKESRLILLLVLGFALLAVCNLLLSFGMFPLLILWAGVGVTVLSRQPLFARAWQHRRATDHVWKHEPEWALERLMSYHKMQTRQEPQNVVLRREHNVRALKMLGASTMVLALCTVGLVVTEGHALVIVVTCVCALAGTFFTGVPTVQHLRQQRKMRDYELEREAFRNASNEISEGMVLVGALSSPISETGGEMSMLDEEVEADE
jgi:hypothetical protein